MRTIAVEHYERYGNDSILKDTVELVWDGNQFLFRHTHQAIGNWFDPVRTVREVMLDDSDVEASQATLNAYLEEELLLEHLNLNIQEYL